MTNPLIREVLAVLSAIGILVGGFGAAAAAPASLSAILFMLAGFGFTGIFIYYFIVRGVEENNNKE